MRIVIDANVLISGVFFGGSPRNVLEAIASGRVKASASAEIVDEYHEIVEEMIARKQGHLSADGLAAFVAKLDLVEPVTQVDVCRDPDDNKFISCAIDAHAVYIVSGDKDLLSIGSFEGVEMVTAAEFCERYL